MEELFNVEIKCDSKTYEYYIDDSDTHNEGMTDWLLNTAAVNDVLSNSRQIADRIFIEDVPSASGAAAPRPARRASAASTRRVRPAIYARSGVLYPRAKDIG